MNLILEDGTGLANANSYASVAEADAYHDRRLHSLTWTAATTPVKERALAMASRTLDAMTVWQGSRATATQALAWPRTGVVYDGLLIDGETVPAPVKNATAELARLLIGEDLTQDVAQNDVESLNLGDGALEIKLRGDREKKRVPSIVGELLQGVGSLAAGGRCITQRKVTR